MQRRSIKTRTATLWWVVLCIAALLFSNPSWAKKPGKRGKPGKRTSKKRKGAKKKGKKLPFSLSGLKLPSNDTSLMRSSTWKKLRPKEPNRNKAAKGKKRKRVPLRKIKMAGQLSLRTKPRWRSAPLGTKKRRARQQISVRDPGGLKTRIRLIIYRRWLGRHGWNRRWQGHIYLKAKQTPRYRCPRKRFCHQLKRDVRQIMRARPKQLSPNVPRFAWRLRRALERYKGYEVEVQTR